MQLTKPQIAVICVSVVLVVLVAVLVPVMLLVVNKKPDDEKPPSKIADQWANNAYTKMEGKNNAAYNIGTGTVMIIGPVRMLLVDAIAHARKNKYPSFSREANAQDDTPAPTWFKQNIGPIYASNDANTWVIAGLTPTAVTSHPGQDIASLVQVEAEGASGTVSNNINLPGIGVTNPTMLTLEEAVAKAKQQGIAGFTREIGAADTEKANTWFKRSLQLVKAPGKANSWGITYAFAS